MLEHDRNARRCRERLGFGERTFASFGRAVRDGGEHIVERAGTAERETLTATESELDDRLAELAARRGTDVGQLYASLQKAGRLKELERGITEEKVFKWLLDQNTVE